MQVAHAELKFNGLRELLSFKERLDEGKFPKQMAMRLKGVMLEVHGPSCSSFTMRRPNAASSPR